MPFEFSWYQPDLVVLLQLEGALAQDEVERAVVQIRATLAESHSVLHFLVDTRQMEGIDNIPATLKSVQSEPLHANTGWVIMVGKMNPMIRFAMDFIGLITKSRYRRFDTMPEAVSFLKEIGVSVTSI